MLKNETTTTELKKQSAKLMNKILLCAATNVFTFLAVAGLTIVLNKRYLSEDIKTYLPHEYAQNVDLIRNFVMGGFLIALLPIVVCIFFVRKRAQIQTELQQRESIDLDKLLAEEKENTAKPTEIAE